MLRFVLALFKIPLYGLQAILAVMVGYLGLLTVAALRAPRITTADSVSSRKRFIILIPAHNEETLLPQLLANLNELDYTQDDYAVHVVADNCTDRTAELARQAGAIVHERFHDTLKGKGYALQWALQNIWDSGAPHDAIVILDADSIVSRNFLAVMSVRLVHGERVIQAYYAVRNPDQSWGVSLRYAALAVLHYLRPQGRMVLGGSAGLKGNGMVFAAEVLRQHPWSASLTEDIEYHMQLILSGERVTFAPDAVVWAEMPGSLRDSHTQNVRWERGRLEMIQKYAPQLLKQSIEQKNFVLFDAAMEQLIPPFSVLAGASVASLAGASLIVATTNRKKGIAACVFHPAALLAAFTLLGQAAYLLTGLALVRAPRKVWLALLYAPIFIVWKLWLYVRVAFGLDQEGWVRTKRNT
jgi:1,2-diacylglycerol 3-beta-glucosyltransferase